MSVPGFKLGPVHKQTIWRSKTIWHDSKSNCAFNIALFLVRLQLICWKHNKKSSLFHHDFNQPFPCLFNKCLKIRYRGKERNYTQYVCILWRYFYSWDHFDVLWKSVGLWILKFQIVPAVLEIDFLEFVCSS